MISFLDDRLPDRFWSKVAPEPNSGCWLWTASTDAAGYGSYFVKPGAARGRCMGAHRAAYRALVGEIPHKFDLDHLCRTPSCVNPAHLEAVTRLVNVRRGLKGILTTHCKRGHDYADARVYQVTRGWRRSCRECGNQTERERYHRTKAQAA